ncbi:NADH-quinone oxidoreductase subunit D [Demequina capsici]|uniref:NADH-quinone oxidoreductase subunit D n=1 Tax=Demequina capsici TaxID=3075620 RepID=A0AA96FC56_9MICO|nr:MULTISPECIES: NADH-quinone oxidoreductase subunit D [unclassified Demequina]WNM24176.1 NADH-quinone oxidoreductase subunit D [Demequina sp. OYTSA14]WNM27004.1 NADH-quinone oxidoreductase subunit D [Demequina sp. PMTSA13]
MTTDQTTPHATGPLFEDPDAPEFTAYGGDWSEIADEASRLGQQRVVINMGPQHPSTHGVLRVMLEIEGETVTEARAGIGYLHTGIEKNMEFRTWTQGVTFATRMDYVASMFNEAVYCLGVEKLLGITDDIPERASVLRVLMMELTRIGSHLVAIGTGGNEMGATTVMTTAFIGREDTFRVIEMLSGLRTNNAYIRPGGVAQDTPEGFVEYVREMIPKVKQRLDELADIQLKNPIFIGRLKDVAVLDLAPAMSLGITGPMLRSTGIPYDIRKADPYCGYETYDFQVPTSTEADAYSRVVLRLEECYESLKIVAQCADRLEATEGQPVMVADKKIAWPAQLSLGTDGQGNSPEHIKHIMGDSMEALIHHFKLVTEGFKVPAGQAYVAIENPKGALGCHVVSDGGTKPWRAHFRDPGFNNLQALSILTEGGQVADVVVAIATIDMVLGGVDR